MTSTKLSTGIKKLDTYTGGGYKKNCIYTIRGNAGTGKTILAMSFILDGCKKGEKCFYFTFEEKESRLIENMESLGFEVQKYIDNKLLTIFTGSLEDFKDYMENKRGNFASLFTKKGLSRVVFDSITTYISVIPTFDQKDKIIKLLEIIDEENLTCLIINSKPIDSSRINDAETEEYLAEGSIWLMDRINDKGFIERVLQVYKMRGAKIMRDQKRYYIDAKGITLS